MKLYIQATIILPIMFVAATFLSFTSFCASSPDDFEKKLQANAFLNIRIKEEVLPKTDIEKTNIEKAEKEKVSLLWDRVLPAAATILGTAWALNEGVVYGGQVGAWAGRAIGGTTAREVGGLFVGGAIGGGIVAGGVMAIGPEFTAVVLNIAGAIEKMREHRARWPNQDPEARFRARIKLIAVLEELAEVVQHQQEDAMYQEIARIAEPARIEMRARTIAARENRANSDAVYKGTRRACHTKTSLR